MAECMGSLDSPYIVRLSVAKANMLHDELEQHAFFGEKSFYEIEVESALDLAGDGVICAYCGCKFTKAIAHMDTEDGNNVVLFVPKHDAPKSKNGLNINHKHFESYWSQGLFEEYRINEYGVDLNGNKVK